MSKALTQAPQGSSTLSVTREGFALVLPLKQAKELPPLEEMGKDILRT